MNATEMNRNITSVVTNLTDNGFQVTSTNHLSGLVNAVDNEGTEITVVVRGAGYCTVYVDTMKISDMVQPYNTGDSARLRRHVGMFENVTMETTR